MPELPEVETVRRTVEPMVRGRRVDEVRVREARLRTRVDVGALTRLTLGRRITAVRRRAKYLLFDLDGGAVLLVHLGMTGRLRFVDPSSELLKHDHVLLRLDHGLEMRFNDARRFGLFEALEAGREQESPRLRHLGLEPLEDLDAATLGEIMRGVKKPVKNFLMDGTKIVGVGNIYACEALFLAGIHPSRPAGSIRGPRVAKLARAIRQVLTRAIERGGTTLRDFVDAEGVAGAYAERLRIYGRAGERCSRCREGKVKRVVQAGRSTFYCPKCQR